MLKKDKTILLAAALSCSMIAFADMNHTMIADQNMSSDQMNASQTDTSDQKSPCFSVYGDFLYWGTYFDYVPYFQKANNVPTEFTNLDPIEVKVGWDPGFRVGVSYYDQDWRDFTTAFEWTSYHSNNSQTVTNTDVFAYVGQPTVPSSVQTLYPFWSDGATTATGAAWQVNYTYSQKFDGFDLLFKEAFYPKQHWVLSAIGGVRGVLNRHHFNIFESRSSNGNVVVDQPPFNTTNSYLSQHFNAIGLLGGLKSSIEFGAGFSFYLAGDVALAFGKAKSKAQHFRTIIANDPENPDVVNTFSSSVNRVLPMVDLDTGLEWSDTFNNNSWGLMFKAAYEAHLFVNFPMYIYMQETYNRVVPINTNMFFQGLTLRAGLQF